MAADKFGAAMSENAGFTTCKVQAVSPFQITKPTCGTLCAEDT